MAKGPGFDAAALPSRSLSAEQAGFRVIEFYEVKIDETVTRLDVKIGSNQYCVGFLSSRPQNREGGAITSDADLFTPKNGVINCFNIKLAKVDLIAALEELVADIRSDVQPTNVQIVAF